MSALDEKPKGVRGERWRYSWNDARIWASFDKALLVASEEIGDYDGLCYCIHPHGNDDEELRLVCFDFDKAIDADGRIDASLEEFLSKLNTFVEYSVSGRGLHAFVLIKCKPFKNALQRPFANCKVDILCSSQIAVTGTVFEGYAHLNEVGYEVIEQFALKDRREIDVDTADVWSEAFEPVGDTDHLVDHMESWEMCCRSSKGSQAGEGGDVEMYKAACHLARHGVTGDAAIDLLGHVPADPAFTEEELRHKVESAFKSVHADEDEFGRESASVEFEEIPGAMSQAEEAKARFPFTTLTDLLEMDLKTSFVVDSLLVDRESLFIGGREKCFKTGIAADLCVSLAAGAPFLGKFDVVEERQKIAFFTAEIGQRATQMLFKRIIRSKGVDTSQLGNIHIFETLPSFQINPNTHRHVDPQAINDLKKYLSDYRPEVIIFDPLYLAMGGASVGDMYAIGAVLNSINSICKDVDVWPIFCHHAKKANIEEFNPMQLGEFYGSGVSAFARQWLLMSHAEPFANGRASLYMNAGGSAAGDCGLWRVGITEGHADELLDRRWDVEVISEDDDAPEKAATVEAQVISALQYFSGDQVGTKELAEFALLPEGDVKRAINEMVKAGTADMTKGCKYQISSNYNPEYPSTESEF